MPSWILTGLGVAVLALASWFHLGSPVVLLVGALGGFLIGVPIEPATVAAWVAKVVGLFRSKPKP